MSLQYKSLLSTAREDANRRMQSKGLSVGRNRSRFIDEDDDVDEKIGGLVPRRDKDLLSDKSTDFLSTLFGNIIEEGKKMLEDEPPGPPGDADSRFLITEELPTGESADMVEVTDNEATSTADFIASFENERQDSYTAYPDGNGFAIGFGTKAKNKNEVISYAEARSRLYSETVKFEKIVRAANDKHRYNFNSNQIQALTSFAYNNGAGGLNKLLDEGNRGLEEITLMITEYSKVDGVESKGLKKRREAELALFTKQINEGQ